MYFSANTVDKTPKNQGQKTDSKVVSIYRVFPKYILELRLM